MLLGEKMIANMRLSLGQTHFKYTATDIITLTMMVG